MISDILLFRRDVGDDIAVDAQVDSRNLTHRGGQVLARQEFWFTEVIKCIVSILISVTTDMSPSQAEKEFWQRLRDRLRSWAKSDHLRAATQEREGSQSKGRAGQHLPSQA